MGGFSDDDGGFGGVNSLINIVKWIFLVLISIVTFGLPIIIKNKKDKKDK